MIHKYILQKQERLTNTVQAQTHILILNFSKRIFYICLINVIAFKRKAFYVPAKIYGPDFVTKF